MRGLNAPPRRATPPPALTRRAAFERLLAALDAAGSGDDGHDLSADLTAEGAAEGDDGRARGRVACLAAGHLVRGQDRLDVVDEVERRQSAAVFESLVTDARDDGAFGACNDVFFETHFVNQGDGPFHLLAGGMGLEDDDHLGLLGSAGFWGGRSVDKDAPKTGGLRGGSGPAGGGRARTYEPRNR